jgi:Zn-dependent peptidase ImmA (M78 family)/transcriptional regulator with XRE-family HTH domain
MGAFNGELLRLARQYRGFNQRELALALFVEPSTVSRIENGIVEPSPDFVRRVPGVLKLPPEFFQQNDRVYGLPLSVHPSMWRKKAAVSQHAVDRALAELNIRMMHLRRLIRAVEYEPALPLPQLDIETYKGDIEAIATAVRRTWMVPAGPIQDLTSWIERTGCFVIHIDLPDAAMDGVTIQAPDITPPCIFLNRDQPADRMRFSLAHELGHLVMHRIPTPRMEEEANAFAGAFLAPAKDILPYFSRRRIDLALLANLKPEWRMAMAALLYRAKQLKFVNDNQARYLWQQFNMHKIRMREPPELDFPTEQPTLMPKLLSLHLGQLGYSVAELQILLSMYEEELVEFHNLTSATRPPGRPKLRIVS